MIMTSEVVFQNDHGNQPPCAPTTASCYELHLQSYGRERNSQDESAASCSFAYSASTCRQLALTPGLSSPSDRVETSSVISRATSAQPQRAWPQSEGREYVKQIRSIQASEQKAFIPPALLRRMSTRQENRKAGSALPWTHAAPQPNSPTVFLNQAVGNPESQSRSLALGGEEWFKDLLIVLTGYPRPVVCNRHAHAQLFPIAPVATSEAVEF